MVEGTGTFTMGWVGLSKAFCPSWSRSSVLAFLTSLAT
jgi:hypothetical protein|eukprot:COSAG02_NODE_5164_length_4578_cov_7.409243_4_plen_38_part_00